MMPAREPRPLPPKCLAAMIGVMPLPGAPLYGGDDAAIVQRAVEDLKAYEAAGVDAIVLENSFDVPFQKTAPCPRAVRLMGEIAGEIRARTVLPVGLQFLEAANLTALKIAARRNLDFVRVEGFVFAHVGGAGVIEGGAGELLRLRKQLNAGHIHVFCDVKKKHCAHALTSDLDAAEVARQCAFFDADGLIVTGPHTGAEPQVVDLQAVGGAAPLPVWIGSGMTEANVERYLPHADGFIVGSTFRREGRYRETLDVSRLNAFMKRFHALRSPCL